MESPDFLAGAGAAGVLGALPEEEPDELSEEEPEDELDPEDAADELSGPPLEDDEPEDAAAVSFLPVPAGLLEDDADRLSLR